MKIMKFFIRGYLSMQLSQGAKTDPAFIIPTREETTQPMHLEAPSHAHFNTSHVVSSWYSILWKRERDQTLSIPYIKYMFSEAPIKPFRAERAGDGLWHAATLPSTAWFVPQHSHSEFCRWVGLFWTFLLQIKSEPVRSFKMAFSRTSCNTLVMETLHIFLLFVYRLHGL